MEYKNKLTSYHILQTLYYFFLPFAAFLSSSSCSHHCALCSPSILSRALTDSLSHITMTSLIIATRAWRVSSLIFSLLCAHERFLFIHNLFSSCSQIAVLCVGSRSLEYAHTHKCRRKGFLFYIHNHHREKNFLLCFRIFF